MKIADFIAIKNSPIVAELEKNPDAVVQRRINFAEHKCETWVNMDEGDELQPECLLLGHYRIKPTPKVWLWCVEYSDGTLICYKDEARARYAMSLNSGSRLIKVQEVL